MNKPFCVFSSLCTFIVLMYSGHLSATTFRSITAETTVGAHIDETGNLIEQDMFYPVVYKPAPKADWVRMPWISPTQRFEGKRAIGMELQPKIPAEDGDVDKVNLTLSSGHDPFALRFGVTRYTGFALKLPKLTFQIPEEGRRLLLAQWWQGSPYSPPVRLAITSATNDKVTFQFWILNNDTLGNPSTKPIIIGEGTILYDEWTRFVVNITPEYAKNGHVQVWLNDKSIIDWHGKVGYDPSTIPYKGANSATIPHPNKAFNVYVGPYRATQARRHQVFYDQVKFADSYRDAKP